MSIFPRPERLAIHTKTFIRNSKPKQRSGPTFAIIPTIGYHTGDLHSCPKSEFNLAKILPTVKVALSCHSSAC